MLPTKKTQFIVTGLAAGLVALIFFLGRNNPVALVPGIDGSDGDEPAQPIETQDEQAYSHSGILESLVMEERDVLTSARKSILDSLDAVLNDGIIDSVEYLMNYAELFEDANAPMPAAYYYHLLAEHKDDEETWFKAAINYTQAQSNVKDTKKFNILINQSIKTLRKVLEHNPDNMDAKAELAVSYFESDKDPVRGIGLLRENYERNSEHKKTLYYLGMINLRSGQYDLARERIEKLISLQPDYAFNYYYLGQIYLNEGKNQKALEAFENYRDRVIDVALKQQANQMINRIKQNL